VHKYRSNCADVLAASRALLVQREIHRRCEQLVERADVQAPARALARLRSLPTRRSDAFSLPAIATPYSRVSLETAITLTPRFLEFGLRRQDSEE
jgi:hypothetical protein